MRHNRTVNSWSSETTASFVARLEAAERSVYPLAMTDTDRYERSVTVIGLLSRHLEGSGTSAQDLERLRPSALIRLRGIGSEQAISLAGLNEEALVDAALAHRYRALKAESAESFEDSTMDQARAAGESWVGLAAPDTSTMGFAVEQTWVDVHLNSGIRLIRTITPDPLTGQAKFRIEVRQPGQNESGLMIDLASRQEWLDEAATLRQTVDGSRLEIFRET